MTDPGPCVCSHSWEEHRSPVRPGQDTTGCYGLKSTGHQGGARGHVDCDCICGCVWFRPEAEIDAAIVLGKPWSSGPWFRKRSEIQADLEARVNKVTGAERRELHRELRSLIHSWANIWQLPPDVWGSLATQAHERAEEIVRLLELD